MSEEIKNKDVSGKDAPKAEKKPKKETKNPFRSKKFKHGSLSVVFTVIFVAAIVLLNIILNLLLDRFDVEVDLTDGGIYTMGEEMEKFISDSDSKVTFYFTSDEETLETAGSVYKQTLELAHKAAAANDNYTIKHVDLLSDPTFASGYTGVSEGGLIIESEETGRYRFFNIGNEFLQYKMSDGNIYDYSEASMMSMYGQASVVDAVSIAEQEILSGLMSITKVNPVKIGVTTGFGEVENPDLVNLLEKNTYVVETINIDMVEKISDEYDIVIINAPTMDYSIEAVNKVDEWLSNGGMYGKNLVYFATVSAPVDTPNIDDFLAEWGLEVEMGFVCQMDSNYAYSVSGYPYPLYQRAEIVTDTDYYTAMQLDPKSSFRANGVRPVKMLWEEKSNFVNTAILQTYGEESVVMPFDANEDWTPENAEEKGQFSLIVEASKVRYEGVEPTYSRVIAAGSENLFTDYFLSATNYNNAEVALAIFNTVSGNAGESITVTPKTFTPATYEIEAAQQTGIGITFAVIIPVIIIITGIVVWVRRKRL